MVHPAWVYKVVLWNRKIHKERQIMQTNVVSQTQGHFADFAIAVEDAGRRNALFAGTELV